MKPLAPPIYEALQSLPVGVLVFRRSQLLWANRRACEVLDLRASLETETPNSPEGCSSGLKALLNKEFINLKGTVLRPLRLRHDPYTTCLLIEVTSLPYIDQFFACVPFAEEILKYLFLNPYEGLNVVDRDGIIRYMSPTHERFLGISTGQAIGRHVTEVIENTRLHIVARTGKAEIGHAQVMRGAERIVARIPIRQNGTTVGAVGKIMFKDLAQVKHLAERLESLRQEVDYYKKELSYLRRATFTLDSLIGSSPIFEDLKRQIRRAAEVDLPVLIIGETGTGKECVAHAIHNLSARKRNPMVTVNCAAIPAGLFESELFGYEPGSFTNAAKTGKVGKFELAHGSTIFLDEIGDMPMDVQSKLLRVLQEGYIEKLGSKKPVPVDFRVVCATNKGWEFLQDPRCFRQDLFYRISAITISVPPLRERKEDIPLLVDHFIDKFNRRYGKAIKGISREALMVFCEYDWPGNIRQLENEVSRACSFADKDVIGLEHCSDYIQDFSKKATFKSGATNCNAIWDRECVLRSGEREALLAALRESKGNKAKAANILGFSRTTLYKKMKKFGIPVRSS
jgi:PAS domain S-box-containing protein